MLDSCSQPNCGATPSPPLRPTQRTPGAQYTWMIVIHGIVAFMDAYVSARARCLLTWAASVTRVTARASTD